jgi:integrase
VAMTRQSLTLWQKRAEARITLTRALDLFDAAYRATNHSLRTVRWYRERLLPFIDQLAHNLDREPQLADLTVANFRLFILEKQAAVKYAGHPWKKQTNEPPSSAYLHGFFRAVRGFSSWLFKERLIPFNVMAELEMPRLEERELQPLTPDEEVRLLDAYSENRPRECRNKAIFLLMLSTGLRKGELIGLKDNRSIWRRFLDCDWKGEAAAFNTFRIQDRLGASALSLHAAPRTGRSGLRHLFSHSGRSAIDGAGHRRDLSARSRKDRHQAATSPSPASHLRDAQQRDEYADSDATALHGPFGADRNRALQPRGDERKAEARPDV